MRRTFFFGLLVSAIAVAGIAKATERGVCRPKLTITRVQFPPMIFPNLERKWTATVLVDASRCRPTSDGHFDLGFSRLKENGMEVEFRERFGWIEPSVKIGVDFWADEAVERYWIENVTTCRCAD